MQMNYGNYCHCLVWYINTRETGEVLLWFGLVVGGNSLCVLLDEN